jgi:hypothetical protein
MLVCDIPDVVVDARRKRMTKHMGRMAEKRKACKIVVGKPKLKKPEALA